MDSPYLPGAPLIHRLWVAGGRNGRGWGLLSFPWCRRLWSTSSVPVRGGRALWAPGERPAVPAARVHPVCPVLLFPAARWAQGTALAALNPTAPTFLPGLCVQGLSELFSVMSQFLFGAFFFFFPLMTRLQLVYPLECAEGLHRNEDPHVYGSDAGEQRSCYKYSSAVFLLTFQFYNPFQKIWTKIL